MIRRSFSIGPIARAVETPAIAASIAGIAYKAGPNWRTSPPVRSTPERKPKASRPNSRYASPARGASPLAANRRLSQLTAARKRTQGIRNTASPASNGIPRPAPTLNAARPK